MVVELFGQYDLLGIVLEKIAMQVGYVSPILIVEGVDGVGNGKTGTLDLNSS